MKFLFSQHQSFIPEQFGRVIFDGVEKKETISTPLEKEKQEALQPFQKEVSMLDVEVNQKKELKESLDPIEMAQNDADVISGLIEKDLGTEEFAKKLTPQMYLDRMNNISKKYEGRIDTWYKNYGKVLPNGWEDNLKIGGVVGAVAFGNTKGGVLDRSKNALKWGSIVAVAAHPAITGGLAVVMEQVGKVAAPTLGIAIPNLVFEMINNPGRLMTAIKESGNMDSYNVLNSPIGDLLLHGTSSQEKLTKEIQTGQQQPSVLRKEGLLRIGGGGKTEFNNILDEMELYETGTSQTAFATGGGGVEKAATFVSQMASHQLPAEELTKLRSRIWNEEGTAGDVRAVLANNSVEEVMRFFESKKQSDPDLWNRFQAELTKTKSLQIPQISKEELKEIFIDPTASAETGGFEMKDSKHGIRRFLSGGIGGAALSLYAISFLLISGLMKVKGLAQPETYTKKPKEKAEKVAKWGSETWKSFTELFKKSPLVAIAGISAEKGKEWTNKDDRNVIKSLRGNDKKTIVKRFRKWRDEKDETYKKRIKEETKDLKGNEKENKKKDIKQAVEMTQDQFKSMFDGVSSETKAKLSFLQK